ncbi:MAG: amidohydrolase [Candidatus Micrarchaeota archaeon]|nr:amidohydrolase [Candidatus Micrarchaeota archaeon]
MSVLIKNATLLSGKKADILLQEGKISKIRPSVSASAEERIDASGLLALPGFVNTHTHCAMAILRGLAEDLRMEDWLSAVRKKEKNLSFAQVRAGALLACVEMLKSGITCFSDMYFHMDAVASAVQQTGIRAVLGYGMVDLGEPGLRKKELAETKRFVKKWHQKAEGRISCAVAPHSVYLCSAELLKQSFHLSKEFGLRLHIHLSETRKEVFDCLKMTGKRPAFYLESLGFLGPSMVAAHCGWLSKEEVRVLARHGVSASLCPVSNMKLATGATAPLPEMQEFGMNVSLGTDGAASNNSLSMFDTMKLLGLAQKNSRWDASIAPAHYILSAATEGGANALGIKSGRLQEGLLADLILIDMRAPNLLPWHNFQSNIIYCAHPGNVRHVFVDGKHLVQDGRLAFIDEEKIKDEFISQASSLQG